MRSKCNQDGTRVNHPVKKVHMKHILGEEINQLLEKGDLHPIRGMEAERNAMESVKDLQVKSTSKGVHMDHLRRFAVSRDGSRAWGIHFTEYPKCRLLMEDFEGGDSLVYDHEHQHLALAFIIAESLNLAVTGGRDKKIVLHCLQSGRTLKVLEMGTESVTCFYLFGSVAAVAGKRKVSFLDLITLEIMKTLPVEVECDVKCMQMGIKKSSKEKEPPFHVLFVGGSSSTKLTEIILPKEIENKSK
jgi:hypothetical protein